jgi:PAS domain S-box-containing protein
MQEESIYRLLFERSAQGMVLRQGERIVLVNQSFADMVGYTIRELMDFSTEEGFNLIHPQDREAVLAGFRDLVAGKHGPRHDEYRFIRRNGETGWWSAALSSIDYEGQPAVLEVCVDITERKKAEAVLHDSDKLLHEIAANYPNSYLSIVESDMTIGFTAGQEFARQNLDPNAFVGQTIEQVFGEHTPTVREHYLQAFAGHDVAFELLINNQHQLYKAVPLRDRDGNIPRILVVVENITERRQAQAEIERLAHDLSERVKELNCLYGISQLVEEPGASLEDIVEGTVRLIPPAFQYGD